MNIYKKSRAVFSKFQQQINSRDKVLEKDYRFPPFSKIK